MFTLRTLRNNSNIEDHTYLGETYILIKRSDSCEQFRDLFEKIFDKKHVADLDETSNYDTKNVEAFIQTLSNTIPIYKQDTCYIMSANGQTFQRI